VRATIDEPKARINSPANRQFLPLIAILTSVTHFDASGWGQVSRRWGKLFHDFTFQSRQQISRIDKIAPRQLFITAFAESPCHRENLVSRDSFAIQE
jgi:hypothetical protein